MNTLKQLVPVLCLSICTLAGCSQLGSHSLGLMEDEKDEQEALAAIGDLSSRNILDVVGDISADTISLASLQATKRYIEAKTGINEPGTVVLDMLQDNYNAICNEINLRLQ